MKSKLLPFLSLLLVVAGPFAYMASLENPLMRSTGLPAFALMAVGVVVGLVSAFSRPGRWPRVSAGLAMALTALFAFGFFVGMHIPDSPQFAAVDAAPDFTLPDQTGKPVSLRQELAKGPVLLVFYRGHW